MGWENVLSMGQGYNIGDILGMPNAKAWLSQNGADKYLNDPKYMETYYEPVNGEARQQLNSNAALSDFFAANPNLQAQFAKTGPIDNWQITDSGKTAAGDTYDTRDAGLMETLVPAVISTIATAGTGLAGNLGTALGASGNAATALGSGLLNGGATLAQGGSLGDAVKSGLLSGGMAYGMGALGDSLGGQTNSGLLAAKDAASGPIDIGGLSAESLAAIQNVPDVSGISSSLANFADTPITVSAPDWSALAQVPADLSAQVQNVASNSSGLLQAMQQAQAPIDAGTMSPEAQQAMTTTPSYQTSGIASSIKPDTSPIEAGQMSAEAQKAIGNTPSVGGGLLNTVKSTGSDIANWMKQNPVMGRLLLSGAGALLNTVGSGSSGGGSAGSVSYADPVKWTSSPTALNQGLLSGSLLGQGVKQLTPQLPTGLLGNPNSGVWRYMKG